MRSVRALRAAAIVAMALTMAAGCGGSSHPDRRAVAASVPSAGCHQLAVVEPLIPIANSLRGCPPARGARALPQSALPFLGVACGCPDWIGCSRVGIGVALHVPAALVVVRLAGHMVALSPPTPGSDLWNGYLEGANFRRGPLHIHVPASVSLWEGSPEVWVRARTTAVLLHGGAATTAGDVMLHPGFG